jgi:hypothetical protein
MKNLAPTGATYDGTINGTYTPAPPLIRAKKSPCMDFDGVAGAGGNYISLADPISGLTSYTFVYWVNLDIAGAQPGFMRSEFVSYYSPEATDPTKVPQLILTLMGGRQLIAPPQYSLTWEAGSFGR